MGKRVIYVCSRCGAERETDPAGDLPKDWWELALREKGGLSGFIHLCPECYQAWKLFLRRR